MAMRSINTRPGPALPLAEQVRRESARRLRALALPYTPEERETWAQQVREAEALDANPAAPAPFLEQRAAARGVTAPELADTVLGLAAAYATQAGIIMGAYDKLIAMDPIPADFRADAYWAAEP